MSPDSVDTKPAPDKAEVKAAALATLPKVQLDIDDAPFLRELEAAAPPKPAPEPDAEQTPETAPAPESKTASASRKKKLIIIAAIAGLVLLLAGGGALWWFVLRTPPPPPSPPVAPTVIVVPGAQAKQQPADFYIAFAPFWLELTDEDKQGRNADKDGVYFLVCKFTAVTLSEAVLQETQGKQLVLRDALYFYLKNKSYTFLTSSENTQTIKNDLVSVLNGYLITGKVEDLLFERFVSK